MITTNHYNIKHQYRIFDQKTNHHKNKQINQHLSQEQTQKANIQQINSKVIILIIMIMNIKDNHFIKME